MEVPILDGQGSVTLVDFLGADDRVADAARASRDRQASEFSAERNDKLIDTLAHHEPQHGVPFEHVVFYFRIEAPIISWWHLRTHRMASWSLQSGRAVEYGSTYAPQAWRCQHATNKQASGAELYPEEQARMAAMLDEVCRLAFARYKEALGMGVAKEQARFLLPAFTLLQSGVVTINARSLTNLLKQRNHPDAQYEVREVARGMAGCACRSHPKLADALGWRKTQP